MSKLSTILVAAIIVSSATPALAESPTTSTTPVRREVRQEVRQEVRPEVNQEVRQQVRNKLAEGHAERLRRRFAFYDQRFESIIKRLNARLNILNSKGVDTTGLADGLAVANTTWQQAKEKGASAVRLFLATDVVAAKELAEEARALYQKTHQELQALIPQLQTLSK